MAPSAKLGSSADQAAWTSSVDSSSGAGAQMYAENRGAASADECPPEITMPTGSSSVASVLFFIMECGDEVRPRNGRGRPPQSTPDANGDGIYKSFYVGYLRPGTASLTQLIVSH